MVRADRKISGWPHAVSGVAAFEESTLMRYALYGVGGGPRSITDRYQLDGESVLGRVVGCGTDLGRRAYSLGIFRGNQAVKGASYRNKTRHNFTW